MEKKKVVSEKVLYSDLSYQILNALFEVHNYLGPGFSEDIYQQATMNELQIRKLPFEAQKIISVCYKEQFIGNYRLDLVIDNLIILELKAVTQLNDFFKQQVVSYLKATGLHLGILANFGSKQLQSVRIINL